jgi:hypothetical protein
VALVWEFEGRRTKHTVWALDVSPLGVRIRLGGALIPGQSVALSCIDGLAARNHPCRVVWSSPAGPQLLSEAGLEFKSPEKIVELELRG